MAKKTIVGEAADAAKQIAGSALGAAAAVATGVVVASLAGAITQGAKKLGEAKPKIQQAAADAVSKPLMPSSKRKPKPARAATRKKVAKKAKRPGRAAKKKRAAPRRKR